MKYSTPRTPSLALFLFLSPLLIVACDDSSPKNPSETGGQTPESSPIDSQQPGSVPPTPLPSPAPSPLTALWSELRFTADCPFPECPARGGFWVEPDGSFILGLTGTTGILDPPDLSRLSDHAARVSEQDLTGLPTCVSLAPLLGRSSITLDVKLSSGDTYRVYQLDDPSRILCWLGDLGRAEILSDTLNELANEYGGA